MPGSPTVKTGERRGRNENRQIPTHTHGVTGERAKSEIVTVPNTRAQQEAI